MQLRFGWLLPLLVLCACASKQAKVAPTKGPPTPKAVAVVDLSKEKVKVPKGGSAVDEVVVNPGRTAAVLVVDLDEELHLQPMRVVPAKDLWLLDPKTGATKRLTKGQRGTEAVFSPKGTVLAVIEQGGLKVYELAAKRWRTLVPETLGDEGGEYDYQTHYGPVWSPDGRHIAVLATSGATETALVVNAEGKPTVVTGPDGVQEMRWTKQGSLECWDGPPGEDNSTLIETVSP